MNRWQTTKLGEVCKIKYGKDHKHLPNGDIPVYGTGGVMRQVDTALYDKKSVLIPRKGSLNNLYFVDTPFWTVDTLFYTEIDEAKISPEFLYYQIKTFNLAGMNVGTAVPSLTTALLNELKIVLPSLTEQIEIGRTLRALDEKIAINTKLNNHLEQIAQAIFKSWFVDFEPFGGSMPDDWEYIELGNVTSEIRTRAKERLLRVLSAVRTSRLVLSDDYFTKQVYSKDINKYIVVEPNDFAYNPARVNIGSLGLNSFDFTGCVSPVYVVFRAKPEYHHFLNFFFKSPNFQEEVRVRASGSVRQSLSYNDFSLIQVLYPSLDVVCRFNNKYENILKVQHGLDKENTILAELRDALLPRLVSGELSVSGIGGAA